MTGQNNEDIEQEVYIKTWKNLENYQEEGRFYSWIKLITVNTCRDYFKSRQYKMVNQTASSEEALINIAGKSFSPEAQLLKKERQKSIMIAIDGLKPKFKEIILLYDIYELSYEEISKKINSPIGTVKSRIARARVKLQDGLKHYI